jgi:hypothetical protein
MIVITLSASRVAKELAPDLLEQRYRLRRAQGTVPNRLVDAEPAGVRGADSQVRIDAELRPVERGRSTAGRNQRYVNLLQDTRKSIKDAVKTGKKLEDLDALHQKLGATYAKLAAIQSNAYADSRRQSDGLLSHAGGLGHAARHRTPDVSDGSCGA